MDLTPFTVRVPATSANLGPGFDALGMALGLYNTVRVEPSARLELEVRGEGAGHLPRDADNLVYRALALAVGQARVPLPPLRLICENAIPLARGLGSSSAAIVGGLLAGNRLAGGRLTPDELLALAVQIESHPDNVTPALLGGVRVCVQAGDRFWQAAVVPARPLRAVAFIPDFELSTAAARGLLPASVSLVDAVYNIGHAALLVAALAAGDYRLLAEATRDRLHQPARAALFPAMSAFFDAALAAGALGAFLSGAGPTLLALVEGDAAAVRAAFEAVAAREGVRGRTLTTGVGGPGAEVLT